MTRTGAFLVPGGPHHEPEEHHISEPRINDRIRVAEVRLVGPNGEQVGIVRVEDALRLAQDADLDLVEVAPDARPPVCKIMDYGKFKYEADMKAREARRNQTNTVLKEIRFRLKIDPHDYGTKKGHVERFLTAGDKVKVMIMFRGREQSRPEMGVRLLQRLADDVSELGFIESMPKQDGRNMVMVIGPNKKKADQKQEQRRAAQAAAQREANAAAAAQKAAAPAAAEAEAPLSSRPGSGRRRDPGRRGSGSPLEALSSVEARDGRGRGTRGRRDAGSRPQRVPPPHPVPQPHRARPPHRARAVGSASGLVGPASGCCTASCGRRASEHHHRPPADHDRRFEARHPEPRVRGIDGGREVGHAEACRHAAPPAPRPGPAAPAKAQTSTTASEEAS